MLLRDESRSDLLFVIVQHFLERFLFVVPKGYFPELDCLVCGGSDQDLLCRSICLDHLLAQHASDVVIMGAELLHYGSLVEAEEIDLVVHACKGVGVVPNGCRCRESCLGNEEAFLRLLILRAKLLNESIH